MQPIPFFQHAFLRQEPWRYAIMLGPDEAQQFGQKYLERRGRITTTMVRQHLGGQRTLAAPASDGEYAYLLPLEIDSGGLAAMWELINAALHAGLWAFGQYCPRADWPAHEQRGSVWLPFAERVPAARLQRLGAHLIGSLTQPAQVTPRASSEVTRLPLGRHTYTGQFGQLAVADQLIDIDAAPFGTLTLLSQIFQENPGALS